MELHDDDAAAYRATFAASETGRLAPLSVPGSCRQRRGGPRPSSSSSPLSSSTGVAAAAPGNGTAWLATLAPTHLLRIRDLAGCVRVCASWPGCRYVTYTPSSRTECSLYASCDLGRLTRQSKTASLELTAEVRRVLQL